MIAAPPIRPVARALQLPLNPSHFVAFMPPELEGKLFEMEKAYFLKFISKDLDEERIDVTVFQVVFKHGAYQAELLEVKPKGTGQR